MRLLTFVLLAAVVPVLPAASQTVPLLLTLQQCIDAALLGGDEGKILSGNLGVSRAEHALSMSRNSFSLAGTAGYGADWTLDNAGAVASPLAAPPGPSIGFAVAGPLTSIGVDASPYIPATPGVTGTGADTSSALGLTVGQTLWNGYRGGPSQAAVDKSLLAQKGTELTTGSGRLALAYGVKKAFFGVLAAQRSLALNHRIYDQQRSVLGQIEAVYQEKLASLADLKTAQFNARSAQADVQSAANSLERARAMLAALTGYALDSDFSVAEVADPMLPSQTVEEAILAGLSRRAEIKQIELSAKALEIDLALARGQATPTLSLSGGVNLLYDWSQATTAAVLGAAVRISMPVLDAGEARNQVDALLRQNEVYSARKSQMQNAIAIAVRSAWQEVALARSRLEAAQMGAEATDLQYQLVSAKREAGVASNQDLLTAAVNLADAENTLAAARSAVQLAVIELQSLTGY